MGYTTMSMEKMPKGKLMSNMLKNGAMIHISTSSVQTSKPFSVDPLEKMAQLFVYVIGLQAVQFGNNWMKKIPRTAKIGRGLSPIWLSEEFSESNYFQIGQACSPLTY